MGAGTTLRDDGVEKVQIETYGHENGVVPGEDVPGAGQVKK